MPPTVLLIPDSFKGSLTAPEVCAAMRTGVLRAAPDAVVHSIPIADGGEGTVECFLTARPGTRVQVPVTGPEGQEVLAEYGLLADGVAVIEMAAAAGLSLSPNRAVETNTTCGVGQLILHALEAGARTILLGLGGSATNDCGCGMAAALGASFFRADGRRFVPAGLSVGEIARIELQGLTPLLRQATVIAACDVDNPLFGPQGAAHVFAEQKGANTPQRRDALDGALRHVAAVVERDLGIAVAHRAGAGAAGGTGAGVLAFLGGRLQRGIELLLDTVGFDTLARGADLVLTGEGRLDGQSLRGKAVLGVARRAKAIGVPVVALAGEVTDLPDAFTEQGLTAAFSINRVAQPPELAIPKTSEYLAAASEQVMRLFLRARYG